MSQEKKQNKSTTNSYSFFQKHNKWENEPEIDISTLNSSIIKSNSISPIAKKSNIDLKNKEKAIFLVGPGGTGKTMFARWIGWKMSEAKRSAMFAALDPQNRSLATWFEDVQQPPSIDGAETSRWLREALSFQMSEKITAIYDFGGGDIALSLLIQSVPDLINMLQTENIEPILFYFLAPRIDDLAIINQLEQLFSSNPPSATAIIMNEGKVDSRESTQEAFNRTMSNSVFQKVINRGGLPLFMPRLEQSVASEIENKRLTFGMAKNGVVPTTSKFSPLGPFDRSIVSKWLSKMEQHFSPVETWLP